MSKACAKPHFQGKTTTVVRRLTSNVLDSTSDALTLTSEDTPIREEDEGHIDLRDKEGFRVYFRLRP